MHEESACYYSLNIYEYDNIFARSYTAFPSASLLSLSLRLC